MEKLTEDYRALLEETHKAAIWGNKGYRYADEVRAFIDALPGAVLSIVDYGCGRGTLGEALHRDGYAVQLYDPGVPGFAAEPAPADLVVSTDVLEHIEPDLIDNVLKHIGGLARKGIFLHIATKKAKRILPDGRNAHLIIQPPPWWVDKMKVLGKKWRVEHFVEGSKTVKIYLVKR